MRTHGETHVQSLRRCHTVKTRRTGRAIRARNKRIIARHGGICHICGHGGADAADHVIPLAQGGPDTEANLLPAHHTEACKTCGIKCNRVKSGNMVAPVIRRSGALNRTTPTG